MRWRGRSHTVRPPRPQVRRLTADEREETLATLAREIEQSPVLKAFNVQARFLRGRFYLEWQWEPADEFEEPDEPAERSTRGRIMPVVTDGPFLLEVAHRRNRWSEVARGSARKLIRRVAGDAQGTFHGLGALDKSLRRAAEEGVGRFRVKKAGRSFVYADTETPCSVPEALYHYFGLPIPVIAQPANWYAYHRRPTIVQNTRDKTRVLVRFSSMSWSGQPFGGTCLYIKREDKWEAMKIRPNQSEDIATAERWLVKRKWKPWR